MVRIVVLVGLMLLAQVLDQGGGRDPVRTGGAFGSAVPVSVVPSPVVRLSVAHTALVTILVTVRS
ncbi:MAG: hypothetical protein CSA70_02895 [Rhodobacterales bacterium]|nr:MAG: hypothetical protein CSA70_02895 [Rhodobacterales bacterium]